MGAEGPKTETSEEKVRILLSRISDAEREFVVTLNKYKELNNPRLKTITENRMNLLLISMIKYAVEGMQKENILPYPDWVNNNQAKITEMLKTPGISHDTIVEVNQLIASVLKPGAVPQPQARAPQPEFRNAYDAHRTERAQREAQERAQRQAQERAQRQAQAEQEKSKREASPEVVAQRRSAFDSVIQDPEAILNEYKSILGFGRMTAKLSAKGKSSRTDIENIVKLFTILKNDKEGDWQENARAAYCYVKSIYDKYDVRYYGPDYNVKSQNPVADACSYYVNNLAKAVTSDYDNIHSVFEKSEKDDYVHSCEVKLSNFDNVQANKPKI